MSCRRSGVLVSGVALRSAGPPRYERASTWSKLDPVEGGGARRLAVMPAADEVLTPQLGPLLHAGQKPFRIASIPTTSRRSTALGRVCPHPAPWGVSFRPAERVSFHPAPTVNTV